MADPAELIVARRMIEDRALKGCDRSVDHAVVDYADENSDMGVHGVIANEARSTSLFGGRRVVSVTHADSIELGKAPKRRTKKAAPPANDPLELLIDSLPEGGDPPVVLVFQAVAFDRRKRVFKLLAERGAVVEVTPPDATTLRAYFEDIASQYNIQVDRAVAQRLWDQLGGGDPARLRQTADRLLLDVGEGGRLTVDRVMDLVPRDRESQVFAITDAVNAGNVVRAIEVTHLLIEHGEQPLMIIGTLAAHYRKLLQVDGAIRAGARRPDEVAKALGMNPYYASKLHSQVQRMRPGALRRAIGTIAAADLALKQTSIGDAKKSQRRWMEEVLISLVRGRRLRSRWSVTRAIDAL